MYGVFIPGEIYTYRTLREYFTATLDKVATRLPQHKQLIILIDGLDHLVSETGAPRLSWLPYSWPKHVHVVLTTNSADRLAMRNLSNHINRIIRNQNVDKSLAELCFWEIDPLSLEELDAMVDYELMRHSRTLTYQQRKVRLHITSRLKHPLRCAMRCGRVKVLAGTSETHHASQRIAQRLQRRDNYLGAARCDAWQVAASYG